MGAGVWCWHDRAQHWGIRVGREDEGSNSKRPEMAALASLLRSIDRTCPCVHLCDNAAVLDSVDKWIGEGSKASLAKDMDMPTRNFWKTQKVARVLNGCRRPLRIKRLANTLATWFRFQGAEQRVKRLDFRPQQECSRAKWGEPVKRFPLDMGLLSARDDRSSRRLVKAPAKHVRDGYGLI